MLTETTLGHDDAKKAIAAMVAELKKRKQAAVLAVADNHGELIALERMDGVQLVAIQIAMNKAWTAARERKPTREVGKAVRNGKTGFDIAYFGDPRILGWGGGLPVLREKKVVGAVAVSGLPEDVDAQIAAVGVRALE